MEETKSYSTPLPVVNTIAVQPISLLQALGHLSFAVLVTDDHLTTLYCNQKFCALFDTRSMNPLLEGVNWQQLLQKMNNGFADPKHISAVLNKAIHNQLPLQKQTALLANGQHILFDYLPVITDQKVTCHLHVFNDDVQNQQAIDQLQKEKHFLEKILHHVPADIAVFSTDARYMYLNPASVTNEELRHWMIGKTDFDYCQTHNKAISLAENRKKICQKATNSQRAIEWEETTTNNTGDKVHHLRNMYPVVNNEGTVDMLIGYGINITERKKIEERIQVSEKRYRDLFNYSQAIICTHNLDGILLTVNPALCEKLGYTEEEVVGRNLKEMLPPEDAAHFETVYIETFLQAPKARGVFRVVNKNGNHIYLLYENFKVEEPGTAPYIIGFAHDITERIQAEKQLKEAKQLTEETARMKERFMANMSHEIRTPMNGILGMANLLKKTSLSKEQQKFVDIINDSAQNLLTIINDILDINKITSGEVTIESIPFDIIGKTRSVLSLFEHTCQRNGIAFAIDNKVAEHLMIEGDPTRYNQILNNLVSNAVKFTDHGTITIGLGISWQDEQRLLLEVSVSDTGIGIEENKLEKIFEPFAQAYPETSRKYGGTGLGLAITKNLVELQGGTIRVKSAPGYGSRFTCLIPYTKCTKTQEAIKQPEAAKPAPNNLGKLKVLLAEDNEVNQLLAKSILMYWGLDCMIASTGTEVIDLINEHDFDIVLMDIQMPEKSGLEATCEIRQLADIRKRNIPIIALTANALKGEEKKYLEAGMDDFLTKPFKEKELYEVVERVMTNNGAFGRKLYPNENSSTATATISLDEQVANERLYDMVLLNDLSHGNPEFIESLVTIFIDTIPENARIMAEAAEHKQWEKVSKMAHKLKSTIDTMNITSLKQDIRSIEINAKNKAELTSVCKQIKKVNEVINCAAQQLKEQFKR